MTAGGPRNGARERNTEERRKKARARQRDRERERENRISTEERFREIKSGELRTRVKQPSRDGQIRKIKIECQTESKIKKKVEWFWVGVGGLISPEQWFNINIVIST